MNDAVKEARFRIDPFLIGNEFEAVTMPPERTGTDCLIGLRLAGQEAWHHDTQQSPTAYVVVLEEAKAMDLWNVLTDELERLGYDLRSSEV